MGYSVFQSQIYLKSNQLETLFNAPDAMIVCLHSLGNGHWTKIKVGP